MKKTWSWLALYAVCFLAALLSLGLIFYLGWLAAAALALIFLGILVLTPLSFWIKSRHQKGIQTYLRVLLCIPILTALVFLFMIAFVDTPSFHFPP